MPLTRHHKGMKIAANTVSFVGADFKPARTSHCDVSTRFFPNMLFSRELAMMLTHRHKGMKMLTSPPGLATFPLSAAERGIEHRH